MLLKNNGVLPLSTATTDSIAVIGQDGGAAVQTIGGGSATVTSSGTVWPITGIQNRAAGTGTTVTYNDATNVASAVTLAQNSDVAVVFASNNYGNEGTDQTTIDLPGNLELVDPARWPRRTRTRSWCSTPTRPTTMPWLSTVAGVFEGFYPGQQYGTAIAALLFGDVNPSGKLPVTFPQSLRRRTGQHHRAVAGRQQPGAVLARGSRSATAGTTSRTSPRCSRSGSACRTPRSRSATSQVGALDATGRPR